MKTNTNADQECRSSLAKQNLQEKASDYAKEQLLKLGRAYPMFDAKRTPDENYSLLTEYATLEASFFQDYITKHSPQKVSEQSQKVEVKKWSRPYRDD